MKLTVNRRLSEGYYYVSFDATDFTPEELQKMDRFGIPQVPLKSGGGPGKGISSIVVPLNQLTGRYNAGFRTEDEAKKYEELVIKQIRDSVQRLREAEDKFTSSQEVSI